MGGSGGDTAARVEKRAIIPCPCWAQSPTSLAWDLHGSDQGARHGDSIEEVKVGRQFCIQQDVRHSTIPSGGIGQLSTSVNNPDREG